MKFKHPELESQLLTRTELSLRALLLDFADASRRWGLPEPEVTCLGRTEAENAAVGGVPRSLHLWETYTPDKPPRSRAADLSVRQYTRAQVEQVLTWLRGEVAQRGGQAAWELLFHAVEGGAQHIHLGRKRPTPRPTP